ncbi:acyl-CoA desaturase [Planctomicrobium sp. SH664]|uniref:acyl-CoA desaturase n=1 Tax=Planctomicrobium sp. SH664 TaxID=3448125 RepID=UPI003F5B115A
MSATLFDAEPEAGISLIDENLPVSPESSKSAPKQLSQTAKERAELLAYFYSDNLKLKNVDWVIAGWMALMHIGAVAALFFVTWQAILVTVVLHWLTCSIGICMTYHRCLSHRSLKLKNPSKFIGTLIGSIAGEGTPLNWTATHRVHHGHSDQPGDPHSPLEGPWWSHLWWMMLKTNSRKQRLLYQHYAPDLLRDPMMMFFEKTFGLWLTVTAVVLYLAGGWPMLLWGMCVRMVFAYHSTWFVNSATHLWGYRNYKTTDASRNLWWVALLSYGEGWHNNHHAHPRLARAGHRWWEVDMTWWTISFLRAIGQATDVDDRIPAERTAHAEAV